MASRISCPICGCRTLAKAGTGVDGQTQQLSCFQCGESYRPPGQSVLRACGMDFLMGLAILAVAACMVLGLIY